MLLLWEVSIYSTVPYQHLSTIVRTNVPNTTLKPETNASLNLGIDLSVLRNRLNISFDYYNNQISDMISAMPLSSIYGSSAHYANIGKMENQGIELSVQASLVRTRDFEWIVGGNIAHATSKIKSLGGEEQVILNYDDEVQMVHRVGESPYQYYGYQADGVFATQVEPMRPISAIVPEYGTMPVTSVLLDQKETTELM